MRTDMSQPPSRDPQWRISSQFPDHSICQRPARTYWIKSRRGTAKAEKVSGFRDWLLGEAADDARRLKIWPVEAAHGRFGADAEAHAGLMEVPSRRILPVSACPVRAPPGEGRLTERIADVQPARRELVSCPEAVIRTARGARPNRPPPLFYCRVSGCH